MSQPEGASFGVGPLAVTNWTSCLETPSTQPLLNNSKGFSKVVEKLRLAGAAEMRFVD